MNQEFDLRKYLELRDRTLANNFGWLESFGCEIRRNDEIVRVTHPHLGDYNVYIVLGLSTKTEAMLEALLMDRTRSDLVYVDEAVDDSFRGDLTRNNYRLSFFSQVKVAKRTQRTTPGKIELRMARPKDLEAWSQLYSKGFLRPGQLAAFDLERWHWSFKDPAIQCWFFVDNGLEVGVFQTYCRNNVIGLYSVTLLPGYRTLARIIAAGRTLRSKLPFNYSSNVYFERVSGRIPSSRTRALTFRSFMTIRRFFIYRRSV